MRILGFDPGVKNFAWALYESTTQEVLAFGWIQAHEANEPDLAFLNSCLETIHIAKPDLVAVERFAYRKDASVESEPINQMIGKLDLLCRMRGLEVVKILPAHWKVKFRTRDYKRGARDLFPDVAFEAVHQADAAGIAKYVYENKEETARKAMEKAAKAEAKKAKLSKSKSKNP